MRRAVLVAALTWLAPALGGALISACEGTIGGISATGESTPPPNASPGGSSQPDSSSPLKARVWKLTTRQLAQTLEALSPGTGSLAPQFGAAPRNFGRFSNDATRLDFSPQIAATAVTAALSIGASASTLLGPRHPCLASTPETSECSDEVLADLARRCFRRPLTEEERADHLAFYASQRATLSISDAWAQVAAAMVLSPSTLFRSELGDAHAQGATTQLTPYETASFLAYAITDSPPDDVLLAEAAAGRLSTTAQRRAQASRLIDGPAALSARVTFFQELYAYDGVLNLAKDATLFPTFDAALGADSVLATDAFVRDIYASKEPTFERLLGASRWFVDARLAAAYGVSGITGDTLQAVDAPPDQRAGLLTQPSVLASFAKATETAPVQRGRLVRVQVLCEDLPPPPMGVPALPSGASASPRMRDRLAIHDSSAFCSSCHKLMDPIGLAFESFDAMGSFRASDHGLPIDTDGTLVGDGDLPFADAVALMHTVSTLPKAERCMVQQTVRWMAGMFSADADTQLVDSLFRQFQSSGGDLRELLLDVVSHPYFVTRER